MVHQEWLDDGDRVITKEQWELFKELLLFSQHHAKEWAKFKEKP